MSRESRLLASHRVEIGNVRPECGITLPVIRQERLGEAGRDTENGHGLPVGSTCMGGQGNRVSITALSGLTRADTAEPP